MELGSAFNHCDCLIRPHLLQIPFNVRRYGRTLLYLTLLASLVVVSAITAYFKAKWTKKHTLISALFFMIVITTLEWLPALMVRSGNIDTWVTILLFPLLAVNAYQILVLPKYNKQSDEDKAKLEERRKARRENRKASKAK